VRVSYVGHATVLLELGGCRLLTDPLLRSQIGPLRRVAPAPDRAGLDGLDAVLISHIHQDHLDLPSLRRLPHQVPLVGPRGAAGELLRAGRREVHELAVGESIEFGRVRVAAVPAAHEGRRWPRGPNAEAIGYLVTGPSRVYFAGDTGLFDGMRELAGGLDLALVPIWGWGPKLGEGHLDPSAAAEALALLRPRYAVPIHWGTIYPIGLRRINPKPLTEPAVIFARKARELAPDVEVRVLAPGMDLEIEARSA
jgi:L-ascorbate metabolism protein UlaG (beta-lactamase superfamily)